MGYKLQATLCLIFQLFPFAVGFWRWRILDSGAKVMTVIAGIGFMTELVALCTVYTFQNNLLVYNVASIAFALAIISYFSVTINYLQRFKIELFLYLLTTAVWLGTIYIIKPAQELNGMFQHYEGVMTMILCLLLIEHLIQSRQYNRPVSNPHFWFAVLLLLAWSLNFLDWSLYDYLTEHHPAIKPIIDLSLTLSSMIVNIGFGIVFLLYPRLVHAKSR